MLALDVNLQQSWRGEELLALLTFVELHICVLCFDVLLVFNGVGKGFVAGAALE